MWTSNLHLHISEFVNAAQDDLTIFAPYIRLDALSLILKNVQPKNISVITTWNTRDILEGYSELEIYPYLRARDAYLFLLPRLHLKVLLADFQRAVLSTANITSRGLGILEPANIESAVYIDKLATTERLWFMQHISQSLLVQDDYFENFSNHVESQRGYIKDNSIMEFATPKFERQRHFLLSSLPMTDTPSELLAALGSMATGREEPDPLYQACLLHDCALYFLDINASREENKQLLKNNFFAHPFIQALEYFVAEAGRRYFGETKAWIQNTCSNVPVPYRKDLTQHIRVLFDWLEQLSEGKYVIEIPHHSECLVKKCKT